MSFWKRSLNSKLLGWGGVDIQKLNCLPLQVEEGEIDKKWVGLLTLSQELEGQTPIRLRFCSKKGI
jgi:hypothetical protein